MEKSLLLLGLLRGQDMHGYQLNEMLAHGAGGAITLSKANAYRLLKKMEEDGWVTYHEEQEGNRPPRRVYSITAEGEAAFGRLLRESLARYTPAEFPAAVAFDFLSETPAEEAAALLQQRRAEIEALYAELDAYPEDIKNHHLTLTYLLRHYAFELEWLDEVARRLRAQAANRTTK